MILHSSDNLMTTQFKKCVTNLSTHISWEGKMKKIVLMALLLVSASTFADANAAKQAFQPSVQTPSLLAKAQQEYLQGSPLEAINTIKSAFKETIHDRVAQNNILSLFKKIRSTVKLADADIGWTLPPEVTRMRVSAARRLDNGVITNQMIFAGEMKSDDEITSFQVIRYPDTIVLDKERRIGRFEDGKDHSDVSEYYYTTQSSPFTVTTGLYLIKMKTKTGSFVNGWFILDQDSNATTTPEVTNLDGNPVFNHGLPQISWNDYKSPQFQENRERRELSIWVAKVAAQKGSWSFWTNDMNTRSQVIGSSLDGDHGWTDGPLDNGDYYALLNFGEAYKFGPIKIVRQSRTVKYFSVKK